MIYSEAHHAAAEIAREKFSEPNEPGFDPGPDADDDKQEVPCDYCAEIRLCANVEGEDLCDECAEGMAEAAAANREESRAERRAMACDLGTGPSDDYRD